MSEPIYESKREKLLAALNRFHGQRFTPAEIAWHANIPVRGVKEILEEMHIDGEIESAIREPSSKGGRPGGAVIVYGVPSWLDLDAFPQWAGMMLPALHRQNINYQPKEFIHA